MFLSDISVRRPVFATVLSLLIVAFGVLSFVNLPLREFPNVDTPIVSVETSYRGASASIVESRITQLIEDRIAGVAGIRSITSSSRDGRSDISIEFDVSRDIDDAANDVRDRVSSVADQLPEGVELPQINKVDADAQPIMWVGLFSETMTRMELSDYAERYIVDRFSAVNGVARVQIGGSARPAMRVWLDRQRLAAFSLTTTDVESALRRQNIELPAGRLESRSMNFTLRLNRAYETVDQFRALPIKRGDNGYLIRLADVALVEVGPENPYSSFRGDGRQIVGMGVVRQSNANLLQVARDVKAVIEDIRQSLPKGTVLSVNFDSSVFVESSINAVYRTLIEAAGLVVLVIFVFLGSLRATLIPAITVPISLIGTFAVLAALGYSINLMTLLALVMMIGLVVDDAIVVLENIYHRIEGGEPPLMASYTGARQVGFAVVATTGVVAAVFVPMFFSGGLVGRLLTELAATMIGAIVISMIVSLTLTPALCSKILKAERKPNRFTRWVDTNFAKVAAKYRQTLGTALDRPLLTAGISLASILVIVLVGRLLPQELAPDEDAGVFFMRISLPEGTGFDYTVQSMQKVEAALLPMLREDGGAVRRLIVRAPGSFGPSADFNSGNATVFLKDWSERDVTTQDVVAEANKRIQDIPEVRGFASARGSLGGRGGQPVQFVIAGNSFAELARARDRLIAAADTSGLMVGLDADYKETKPQMLIDVDTNRAADLGVSAEAIGQTLETMLGSRRVSTYLDRGEEYYVLVQAQRADRLSLDDLANTYVRSDRTGELIPMSNLVRTRESADAGTLGRYNKMRAITLSGSLAPGAKLGDALTFLEETVRSGAYPEVKQTGLKGESLEFRESGSSLYFVLGLAIVVIFLVLAAQFESFVHPLTIILTVPLAIAGALVGIWLTGGSLNVFSQVGIIMLVGLATKNGILIVEFANQLRDDGLSVRDAVLAASERRLRPIVMTSIATVAGAVPLMLSSGPGAASREAVGTVVVFGVSVATLFTLLVIPTVYARLARYTRSPEAVTRDLSDQIARAERQPAE